ncbi:RluA family pseudouridine synthase [Loigolactobacillus coryniformis]|uniref:Pseudouridine synthase n=1 Tax=Loigolactobacillus coryniformis subsp. coryniformis KCTC 3167 = DSM 20001 TaxID=913848 RepID=A0A0R1F9C5_9LACO|nr:RluA family pseudouridine synthase [Loigolactobacillus coryniformis]ATO55527.1 pseudouridine synthase [Loigolactobacillus coryniformis subsp. coryniformis KCTC 3167 = DSM 20001]KRK18316.1 ribosomal large subunit pseudouridine synthase D [Loigolactobacillus coryniformis subsp. coryniformis KCTC 3167 = DSM 20001]
MQEENLTLTVTTENGRLDKVISSHFEELSRAQVQQLIKTEHVQVNGQLEKAKYAVAAGDQITVSIPAPAALDVQPQNIPLDIVYEDDDVLVVNKPQGMVVHPAPGHPQDTLVNALLYHSPLSTINGVIRPGIVHRIDKDTSGLLMVAKNDQAHISLAAQLQAKTSQREYLALVHGVIKEDKGTIDAPIARAKNDRKKQAVVAGGKHAVTHFEVLERFNEYTLIKCILETGRTHQIRVHMKYIGHPVAGDPLYGPKKTLKGHGQFLHAALLGFKHPRTGEQMTFTTPLPSIFEQTLATLRKQVDR